MSLTSDKTSIYIYIYIIFMYKIKHCVPTFICVMRDTTVSLTYVQSIQVWYNSCSAYG